MRSESPEHANELDHVLFSELGNLRGGLTASRKALTEVGEIVDKLTEPPWHAARFLECVEQDGAPPIWMHLCIPR